MIEGTEDRNPSRATGIPTVITGAMTSLVATTEGMMTGEVIIKTEGPEGMVHLTDTERNLK